MSEGVYYLKGINGLRAIASISVVLFHINHSLKLFGLTNLPSLDLAGFGVTIFFSISGFLITILLLKEKDKQTIGIANFYVRRILRIWPLYFLVLMLSVLTAYLFDLGFSVTGLLFYILVSANIPFIFDTTLPLLGHYWSLGVEEQFYLFWPLIISKSKNILKTVCLFTVTFYFFRLLFRLIEIHYGISIPYLIIHVTRFDCISIGAIGAILVHQNKTNITKFVFNQITQIISWSVIVLIAFNRFHIASVLDQEIVATITAILIINFSFNPKTLINLESRFFNFLGKISFGIYVMHQLVIFYFAKTISVFQITGWVKYIIIYFGVLTITVFLAYLSYELFEKRFLNLKSKFTSIESTNINTSLNDGAAC